MSDLLPCPFCGAEATVIVPERDGSNFIIVGCSVKSMLCPNPRQIIYQGDDGIFDPKWWNQRADTLPDQQELVKMFEKTLPDDCDWIATAILNRIKGGRG